jgi:hypothetical protein
MRLSKVYSHLNGLEYLQIHAPHLLTEIQAVIEAVDASKCKLKVSREKPKLGRILYCPQAINAMFARGLWQRNWRESRVAYWVTEDEALTRRTMPLRARAQKREIEAAGQKPIKSYNQTDFVKERVAVEIQFGKYSFVAYDMFVKHLAFYVNGQIDVGVEIVAMKALQKEMASGPGYYEGELYNVIRHGRGVPAVPLVLIGIEANTEPLTTVELDNPQLMLWQPGKQE